MELLGKSKIPIALVYCLIFAHAPVAIAGEKEKALEDYQRAKVKFYEELKSQENTSRETAEQLRKKILEPAVAELKESQIPPKSRSEQTPRPVSQPSQREEVVLDGSQIPKEIEFPSSTQATESPKDALSATDKSGVSEIEFNAMH